MTLVCLVVTFGTPVILCHVSAVHLIPSVVLSVAQ